MIMPAKTQKTSALIKKMIFVLAPGIDKPPLNYTSDFFHTVTQWSLPHNDASLINYSPTLGNFYERKAKRY